MEYLYVFDVVLQGFCIERTSNVYVVLKMNESKIITPETLRALKEGNEQAFEAVYLRYVSSVRNFLSALVRSDEAGMELTQESFVALWERRENIDPEKNISGYLHTIAKNNALKFLNRRKNSNVEELSDADDTPNPAVADSLLVAGEMEILMDIAISEMPTKRRKIFELSRKDGLSNQEIADKLNISKNTVENHVTSALKNLRMVLSSFLAFMVI
jgi:RNA polymerase sigma-70 factor (ECF subfamily)